MTTWNNRKRCGIQDGISGKKGDYGCSEVEGDSKVGDGTAREGRLGARALHERAGSSPCSCRSAAERAGAGAGKLAMLPGVWGSGVTPARADGPRMICGGTTERQCCARQQEGGGAHRHMCIALAGAMVARAGGLRRQPRAVAAQPPAAPPQQSLAAARRCSTVRGQRAGRLKLLLTAAGTPQDSTA